MQRRDYILDQIEQLQRILSRLLSQLSDGRKSEARTELDMNGRLLAIDLEQIAPMAPETLLAMMALSGPFDARRARSVGEMLRADSILSAAEGNAPRAMQSRIKAIWLFLRCVDVPDYTRRPEQREVLVATIRELAAELGDHPRPAQMSEELKRFLARSTAPPS
jgi:hypothetical protein